MILEKLKEIVQNVSMGTEPGYDMGEITMDSRLYEDLYLDSVTLLMIVIAIEEEFGVELAGGEAAKCVTVGDVVALIEREQAK